MGDRRDATRRHPWSYPRQWIEGDAHDRGRRDDGLISEERVELRELRHKVRRPWQEREIRKQATVFLAGETR